jgi:hypothetical protein
VAKIAFFNYSHDSFGRFGDEKALAYLICIFFSLFSLILLLNLRLLGLKYHKRKGIFILEGVCLDSCLPNVLKVNIKFLTFKKKIYI